MKHDSDIIKRIKSYFMRRKSAGEAYKFEREIERDPFLYEAVEGLEDMLTSDIQQALDELDDRLDEKQKKSLFVFTWQAAAIGLVLIVGVSVFAILGSGDDSSETCTTEETDYNPRNVNPSFSEMDELKDTWASNDNKEQLDAAENEPASKEIDVAVNDLQPKKDLIKKDAILETTEEPSAQKKKVETESDLAISESNDGNANEEFDEVAAVSPRTKSVSALSATSTAPQEENISSKPTATPVSQPKGGMASYQTYLKKSLQKSNGMPSGSVVVTFEFDKDGTPRKIEVAKSLCTACDAEAMRVIENGPKWHVNERKERVSVTVSF